MTPQALKCPMCGAPAATDATRCDHCGARLATVACPSCFGMMFLGDKFCPHCGAQAQRTEIPGGARVACPRCRVELSAVLIGNSNLRECPRCEGIWADADTLMQICADKEKQAAVLGIPGNAPEADTTGLETVRYVPCPVCRQLMNRVNFANCSHVVVDVCSRHGTWFDKDELRRIVEFIRSGGLETAREREIRELDERRREARSANLSGRCGDMSELMTERGGSKYDAWDLGISAASVFLKVLFK